MIAQLLKWDKAIFLFLNDLHTDWADPLFYGLSQVWVWIPLYIAIAGLLVAQYRKRACVVILLLCVMIFCTDQTCNLLKNSVCRLRPSHNPELISDVHLVQKQDGRTYYGGPYGFPSAHAANTMALAFSAFFFLRKYRKWLFPVLLVWSLVLAYSRIYLGVHYPLDIITGFVIGCCWAFFVSRFYFGWLEKKVLKT